jgi:hypothetical protein
MEQLTLQDVFNKNWQCFVIEGQPRAVNTNQQCCYKTSDGKKCAIGVCIPDEIYRPTMNGSGSVYGLMQEFGSISYLFGNIGIEILAALQSIHDSGNRDMIEVCGCVNFTEYMKESLIRFAQRHDLTIPTN